MSEDFDAFMSASGADFGLDTDAEDITTRSLVTKGFVALVVDPDRVSQRFIERSLRLADIQVEATRDGTGALDILGTDSVDIVVSETQLGDMSGVQLLRRLKGERRLEFVPFIFVSADTKRETKLAALNAGAYDYLTKPCDGDELGARARRLIDQSRKMTGRCANHNYLLAGDFEAIAFGDLCSMFEYSRRTGILALMVPSGLGQILFENGMVVGAFFRNLVNEPAFYRLSVEERGQFEFTPGPVQDLGIPLFTPHSAAAMLLEAARRFDTQQRDSVIVSTRDLVGDLAKITGNLEIEEEGETEDIIVTIPALSPTRELATAYETGISDAFCLGELQIWTHPELERWLLSTVGSDRMVVLMITDDDTGISALSSISTPLSEKCLRSCIRPEPKVAGVTFYLRNDRVLEVLAVDYQSLGSINRSLTRTPSVVILAPGDGDLLGWGFSARVQINLLLSSFKDSTTVGVGAPAIRKHLGELPSTNGKILRTKYIPGTIGMEPTGLREVLCQSLNFWGQLGPGDSPWT